MGDAPTLLMPRVGSDPPRWPTVDRDLPPPLVVRHDMQEHPSLLLLERLLAGLHAL